LNHFLRFLTLSAISAASLPDFKKCINVTVLYAAANHTDSQEVFTSLAQSMHPELISGFTHDTARAKAETVGMLE
jgi:hypothetical protein